MSNGPPPDYRYELYKLEYERAADRYENIYKSIWQNFSYMAALAGGIVAFGSKGLTLAVVAFIALVPLGFWFWATFVPMNSYGEKTRARLAEIEGNFNRAYLSGLPEREQLQHFRDFQGAAGPWRVRTAVYGFGAVVTTAWVISIVLALTGGPNKKEDPTIQLRAEHLDVATDTRELQSIHARLDSVSAALSAVSAELRRIQTQPAAATSGGGSATPNR